MAVQDDGLDPHRRYVLDVMKEEMKFISDAIKSRNDQSNQIKQWCLTLWMATWGVVTLEFVTKTLGDDQYLVLLAPALFPPLFFVLDIINKRHERKFSWRAKQIHWFMNGREDAPPDAETGLARFVRTGDLGGFRVYDPAAMIWYSVAPDDDEERRRMAERLRFRDIISGVYGFLMFYVSLFVISLVASGLFYWVQTREGAP